MQKNSDNKKRHNVTITLSGDVFETLDRISSVNRRTRKQQLEVTVESVFLTYETVKKLLVM